MYDFEWDGDKAQINVGKHGVTFDEAATIFNDFGLLNDLDGVHSDDEDRFRALGMSSANRLLVVIYTERVRQIRIISARRAKPAEKRNYERNIDNG